MVKVLREGRVTKRWESECRAGATLSAHQVLLYPQHIYSRIYILTPCAKAVLQIDTCCSFHTLTASVWLQEGEVCETAHGSGSV